MVEVFEDIPFVEFDDLETDNNKSLINSRFFVDYSSVVTPERVVSLGLGDIKLGYEWFAFIFGNQPIDKRHAR